MSGARVFAGFQVDFHGGFVEFERRVDQLVRSVLTLARISRSSFTVMFSLAARSSVISQVSHWASLSSLNQTKAFISTRSIMPRKLSSEPKGS